MTKIKEKTSNLTSFYVPTMVYLVVFGALPGLIITILPTLSESMTQGIFATCPLYSLINVDRDEFVLATFWFTLASSVLFYFGLYDTIHIIAQNIALFTVYYAHCVYQYRKDKMQTPSGLILHTMMIILPAILIMGGTVAFSLTLFAWGTPEYLQYSSSIGLFASATSVMLLVLMLRISLIERKSNKRLISDSRSLNYQVMFTMMVVVILLCRIFGILES